VIKKLKLIAFGTGSSDMNMLYERIDATYRRARIENYHCFKFLQDQDIAVSANDAEENELAMAIQA
jgi:hypothetical protein